MPQKLINANLNARIVNRTTEGQYKFVTYNAEYNNGNSGNATTIDWRNGNKQTMTVTGAPAVLTFTAPIGSCNLVFRITQGSGGSKTITWPSTVKWPAGTAPTLSTTANDVDIICFYYSATTGFYYGVASLDFS